MRGIRFVERLLRVREWAPSTVPALCCGLLLPLASPGAAATYQLSPVRVLLAAIVFSTLLAFGYAINDYSDYEVDMAAGKRKVIQDIGKPSALAVMVALVAVGILCSCLLSRDPVRGLLWSVHMFAFGASYSVGPRFKERGVLGLVVSSAAQRSFPVVAVFGMSGFPWGAAVFGWAAVLFVNGLRYILVHQLMDLENDVAAGVRTFAVERGIASVRHGIRASFAIELALISFVLIPLVAGSVASIPIAAVLGIYVLIALAVRRIVRDWFGKSMLFSFDFMALEPFYNAFAPAVLTILVGASGAPGFLVLLVPLAVLERRVVLSRLSVLKYYFPHDGGGSADV